MFFLPDFFTPFMQGQDFAENLQKKRIDNQQGMLQTQFDYSTYANSLLNNNNQTRLNTSNVDTAIAANGLQQNRIGYANQLANLVDPLNLTTADNNARATNAKSAYDLYNLPKFLDTQNAARDQQNTLNTTMTSNAIQQGLQRPAQLQQQSLASFQEYFARAIKEGDVVAARLYFEQMRNVFGDRITPEDIAYYEGIINKVAGNSSQPYAPQTLAPLNNNPLNPLPAQTLGNLLPQLPNSYTMPPPSPFIHTNPPLPLSPTSNSRTKRAVGKMNVPQRLRS